MAIAYLLIFYVFLLIILQVADLRITYKEDFRVRISFTIFAFTFLNKRGKKISLNQTIKAVKNTPLLLKAAKRALKRSDVKVIELSCASHPSISDTLFASIPILISASSILAYISANAASFSIPEDQGNIESDTQAVDILFKTRVLNLIISVLIFLYYILKRKIRRAIKNV